MSRPRPTLWDRMAPRLPVPVERLDLIEINFFIKQQYGFTTDESNCHLLIPTNVPSKIFGSSIISPKLTSDTAFIIASSLMILVTA